MRTIRDIVTDHFDTDNALIFALEAREAAMAERTPAGWEAFSREITGWLRQRNLTWAVSAFIDFCKPFWPTAPAECEPSELRDAIERVANSTSWNNAIAAMGITPTNTIREDLKAILAAHPPKPDATAERDDLVVQQDGLIEELQAKLEKAEAQLAEAKRQCEILQADVTKWKTSFREVDDFSEEMLAFRHSLRNILDPGHDLINSEIVEKVAALKSAPSPLAALQEWLEDGRALNAIQNEYGEQILVVEACLSETGWRLGYGDADDLGYSPPCSTVKELIAWIDANQPPKTPTLDDRIAVLESEHQGLSQHPDWTELKAAARKGADHE